MKSFSRSQLRYDLTTTLLDLVYTLNTSYVSGGEPIARMLGRALRSLSASIWPQHCHIPQPSSCSSLDQSLTEGTSVQHACPELRGCTMGSGRSWRTAHAQSSGHARWATVPSISTQYRKGWPSLSYANTTTQELKIKSRVENQPPHGRLRKEGSFLPFPHICHYFLLLPLALPYYQESTGPRTVRFSALNYSIY